MKKSLTNALTLVCCLIAATLTGIAAFAFVPSQPTNTTQPVQTIQIPVPQSQTTQTQTGQPQKTQPASPTVQSSASTQSQQPMAQPQTAPASAAPAQTGQQPAQAQSSQSQSTPQTVANPVSARPVPEMPAQQTAPATTDSPPKQAGNGQPGTPPADSQPAQPTAPVPEPLKEPIQPPSQPTEPEPIIAQPAPGFNPQQEPLPAEPAPPLSPDVQSGETEPLSQDNRIQSQPISADQSSQSVVPEGTPFSIDIQSQPQIEPPHSHTDDLRQIDEFLSAFTEIGLFNTSAYNITTPEGYDIAVAFGVWHNYAANRTAIRPCADAGCRWGKLTIQSQFVENAVRQYFGTEIHVERTARRLDHATFWYDRGLLHFADPGKLPAYRVHVDTLNQEGSLLRAEGTIYDPATGAVPSRFTASFRGKNDGFILVELESNLPNRLK